MYYCPKSTTLWGHFLRCVFLGPCVPALLRNIINCSPWYTPGCDLALPVLSNIKHQLWHIPQCISLRLAGGVKNGVKVWTSKYGRTFRYSRRSQDKCKPVYCELRRQNKYVRPRESRRWNRTLITSAVWSPHPRLLSFISFKATHRISHLSHTEPTNAQRQPALVLPVGRPSADGLGLDVVGRITTQSGGTATAGPVPEEQTIDKLFW